MGNEFDDDDTNLASRSRSSENDRELLYVFRCPTCGEYAVSRASFMKLLNPAAFAKLIEWEKSRVRTHNQ